MIPDIQNNAEIEKSLEELPELVSRRLFYWRESTMKREKIEAELYLKFCNDPENPDRRAGEINAMVKASDERYAAVLKEAEDEAAYNLAYERLMSAKKISGLRTAF